LRLSDIEIDPQKPVLVIGAAGLDIVGKLSSEPILGSSTPAEVRPSFGGVARNVAENLGRLGQPVTLITAIGQDDFGLQMLKYTSSAGVNTDDSLISEKHHTASYLAILDASGRLQYALEDMQILTALNSSYIRQKEELFHNSSIIFIDANLEEKTLKTVFQLAHKAHVPVCTDSTSINLAKKLIPYLPKLSVLTANTVEAEVLTQNLFHVSNQTDALQAARYCITKGVDIAVITISGIGVCYASSETNGFIPAIHTPVLDPTGGGAALTATLLYGLLNEMDLDDAVRLGMSAASLTLRFIGTVVPDLSLEKLYDQLVI